MIEISLKPNVIVIVILNLCMCTNSQTLDWWMFVCKIISVTGKMFINRAILGLTSHAKIIAEIMCTVSFSSVGLGLFNCCNHNSGLFLALHGSYLHWIVRMYFETSFSVMRLVSTTLDCTMPNTFWNNLCLVFYV